MGIHSVLCAVAGKDVDTGPSFEGFDRDHYPGIFGKDVGRDEIDFFRCVRNGFSVAASVGSDEIGVLTQAAGRLDLDAEQAFSGIDDEIVTVAVTVRLGDGEAEAGGFPQEGQLGQFSSTFRCALAGTWCTAAYLTRYLRIVRTHNI